MLMKSRFIGLFLVFMILTNVIQVFAIDEKELERQSDQIAKLLVSCRAIIAQNQGLFNDPEKGDKGFTGDVYISKVKEHYMNTTGIEVSESDASSSDPLKKALGVLLVSAKAIIDESQTVLNLRGMGFKNVILVVIGRRISHKYIFNKMLWGGVLPQADEYRIQKSG